MDLKKYLAESTKTYNYRIKTVVEMDDKVAATIEEFLKRFNVLNTSKVSKTILQKNPMDFSSLQNREVFMMDVTLGLPVSSYLLQRQLAGLLRLPENYLVVRGEHDPLELQNDSAAQLGDIKDQAEAKGLTQATVLGTDSDYPEADQTADGQNYYGDAYNSRLLSYMKELAKVRDEESKVDAPDSLFSWLELKDATGDAVETPDFNADITSPEEKKEDKDALKVSGLGNFSDDGKTVKKTYTDKSGNVKTLSGTTGSMRTK